MIAKQCCTRILLPALAALSLVACSNSPPDSMVERALQLKGSKTGEYRVVELKRTNGHEPQPGYYTVEFEAVVECLEMSHKGAENNPFYVHYFEYCDTKDTGSRKSARGSISFQSTERGWRPVGPGFTD
jgi:hypothetical protein